MTDKIMIDGECINDEYKPLGNYANERVVKLCQNFDLYERDVTIALQIVAEPCSKLINNLEQQLKRKEEECEKLKMQYNCYSCGTCNGKEDYKNLARHCENALRQLQAEKEKVKELEERLKTLDEEAVTVEITEKELEKYEKYKQALEEIKEVAEDFENCYGSSYSHINKILQKCEVLND